MALTLTAPRNCEAPKGERRSLAIETTEQPPDADESVSARDDGRRRRAAQTPR
jgi:hypothetical protein